MRKSSSPAVVVLALALCVSLSAAEAARPPAPVPCTEIPDLPDDAERHIVVKAQHRGPVWLYTGFLNTWHPDMDFDMIAWVRPKHWRHGMWPFWFSHLITADHEATWRDFRDSPELLGRYLDTMMRLREDGMAWQTVLHHKGPYYGRYRITADMLDDFYNHMYMLVRYSRSMGLPFDYYEICNEPLAGPYEGLAKGKGGYWHGTWAEFLGMWDTACKAIRDACPEAKVVGPSYSSPTPEMLAPFLDHCREKGQRLDVLSWHENIQKHDHLAIYVDPHMCHKNIMAMRRLVEEKYADLGIREIHIDEWGSQGKTTGPGVQIAFFYYFDLAGVDRVAKSCMSTDGLSGLLVGTVTPRTSYWTWAQYARQDGGLRLVTETDDRCVVALASRHDDTRTVRALLARSKRDTELDFGRKRPPVKTTVTFEGLPLQDAELTIVKLGPYDGPFWQEDVDAATMTSQVHAPEGKLTLTLDEVREQQVYAVTIAPPGAYAAQEAARPKLSALAERIRKVHREAMEKAQAAASQGVIRINCGAELGYVDSHSNGWLVDRVYESGSYGHDPGESGYESNMINNGDVIITSTDDPDLYRTQGWGWALAYRITVASGDYLVRLHFAENTWDEGPNRKFDINIEEETVAKDFCPVAETGERRIALIREFPAQVADDVLDIAFVRTQRGVPASICNAIEVIRK